MTDIAATAARLAAIEHTIADLTDEARTLRQMLVDAVEVGGTIQNTDGTPLYRVAPGRLTFKPAVADTILSDTLRQACTKQVIDGAAVKKLSPALWEQCCTQGEPFLTRAAS